MLRKSGSAAAFAALLLLISLAGPAMARRHLHQEHDHSAMGHDHSAMGHDHSAMGHDHSSMGHDHSSMGHDHSSMGGGAPTTAVAASDGMDMPAGSGIPAGSVNMDDPCYATPSDAACAGFNRTDADWEDDLSQLCAAMPFMVGCTLWEQCANGTASGPYCALPSLVGATCADMPLMKGCEAYNALCSNTTAVEQCLSPGPVPDAVTTFTVRDGIEGICGTHCMPGCEVCGASASWRTCTEPLMVLARMCYEMPMPECQSTGFTAMCADPDVAANFGLVCSEPPAMADNC